MFGSWPAGNSDAHIPKEGNILGPYTQKPVCPVLLPVQAQGRIPVEDIGHQITKAHLDQMFDFGLGDIGCEKRL